MKPLIDALSRLESHAVAIAERTEHMPMVLVFLDEKTSIPVGIAGAKTVPQMLEVVRETCAQMHPQMAVFINEGWGVREDAPPAIRQRVLDGMSRVSRLLPEHRVETLVLYGEDWDGNWALTVFNINARQAGGVVLSHRANSQESDTELSTTMRNFVPRRTYA